MRKTAKGGALGMVVGREVTAVELVVTGIETRYPGKDPTRVRKRQVVEEEEKKLAIIRERGRRVVKGKGEGTAATSGGAGGTTTTSIDIATDIIREIVTNEARDGRNTMRDIALGARVVSEDDDEAGVRGGPETIRERGRTTMQEIGADRAERCDTIC